MGHSFATNLIHVVFSTKERRPLIPAEKSQELFAFVTGVAKTHKIQILAVGGIRDHIHLLIGLPPTIALATAVQKIEANSSRWLGTQVLWFEWQKGYAAFSVSPSQVSAVKAYIMGQAEHHKKRDFKAEFTLLLLKSGVRFDPEQVLD